MWVVPLQKPLFMKNTKQHVLALFMLGAGIVTNALHAQETATVTVKNALDFERSEVVAVLLKDLSGFLTGKNLKDIRLKNAATGTLETLQWIDNDGDGTNEEVLFMATIPAMDARKYTFVADGSTPPPIPKYTTFSRFVPERTDDYTWENELVAFRTYGPDAQMRTEKKLPNGTLSSGIDVWFKNTKESIINKWYAGYKTDPQFYHKDRGEGYDPYHVGGSRGTGGTGIWEGDSLYVSKNFVKWKTITTGPLRTIFELNYAAYSPYEARETKRISLDLGSNFSKFEIKYNSQKPVSGYATGITLHKNEGTTNLLPELGIFSHNEKIDNIYVGEGLVIDPKLVQKSFVNKSKTADQSNLIVLFRPGAPIVYYAGFAWAKSGQVTTSADWDALLKKQAQIVANPLIIAVK
jgi:Domain of unknown function (DUF4861)